MARKRIAIENTLGNVSEYLSEKGYEVVQLDPHTQTGIELKNCDAIVIAGTDDNIMGITTIKTEAPVINVKGMNEQEILNRLESTFKNFA